MATAGTGTKQLSGAICCTAPHTGLSNEVAAHILLRSKVVICGMEVLRSDLVLVGMVTIGVLGVLFDAVFRWFDRRYNWMGE